MNEDVVADLKQFITAVITRQTSDLREDMSGMKLDISTMKLDISSLKEDISGLKKDISGLKLDVRCLDQKIDNLSAAVAEALDNNNEATEARLKDHEHRLTHLEKQTA